MHACLCPSNPRRDLIHDCLGQVVRPERGVVGHPQPRVDLRDDDLLVGGTDFIHFFAKQGRGVIQCARISTSCVLSRGIIWYVLIACSSAGE